MKILLDTHVFLWIATDDEQLTASLRATISDTRNQVFLSVASVWEATIKHQLGKLRLPQPPTEYLPQLRRSLQIDSLTIDESSLSELANLPPIHRDPFDRIIIAQAIQHGTSLATADAEIQKYAARTKLVLLQ